MKLNEKTPGRIEKGPHRIFIQLVFGMLILSAAFAIVASAVVIIDFIQSPEQYSEGIIILSELVIFFVCSWMTGWTVTTGHESFKEHWREWKK